MLSGSRVQTYQQNKTHIPDQNFEQALIDGGYDTTIDTYIDDSSMLGVTQLDLSNRQITDFTGLEEFVNLTDLNLSGNAVTSVPLVNLNKLTTLNLSNTGLTELDLSQNSNITSLNLSGNSALSCVKVSPQVYQQVPSGWTYDSTTSFELECDCPTLSLTSGTSSQTLCDGEAMQPLVYEFGGTGTTINVGTMPSGLLSSVNSGTLTISGTPVFTNNDYSFSVFTTDGNANCSQVSQTVTLSKNQSSPSLTLDSGSYNQTIDLGNNMTPIVLTYGGVTSGLTVVGLPFTQSGNSVTINKTFTTAGTYSGTITTVSSGGCSEITQSIGVTVNAPVVTNTGGTTTGGTTSGGTNTSGNTSGGAGVVTTFGNIVPNGYLMAFSNGYLYAWSTDNKIQKISISTGAIESTIDVGGYGDGLTVDSDGNIYTHPSGVLRKTNPAGSTSVLAGGTQGYAEGTGANAQFQWSVCMIIGPDGNIYSTDSGRVRKITPSGVVTTYFEDTNNESFDGYCF